MSETIELELCPHCGSVARTVNRKRSEQDEWHVEAFCSICDPFHMKTYSIENWNRRPIEDQLRARAERAEADAERLANFIRYLLRVGQLSGRRIGPMALKVLDEHHAVEPDDTHDAAKDGPK